MIKDEYESERDKRLAHIARIQELTLAQNRNDFHKADGLTDVWSCDCGKCFHRFICKDKHDGFYCKSYFNSDEHDKQVRADVIDEFVKAFKDNMLKSTMPTWMCYVEEIAEKLKEQK